MSGITHLIFQSNKNNGGIRNQNRADHVTPPSLHKLEHVTVYLQITCYLNVQAYGLHHSKYRRPSGHYSLQAPMSHMQHHEKGHR